MSGPKVDIAELRCQEMAKLAENRNCRITASDRIKQYILRIKTCLGNDMELYKQDESLKGCYDKIILKQEITIKELEKLLFQIKEGDEQLDIAIILDDATRLNSSFYGDIQEELTTIQKLSASSETFKELQENRQRMVLAKRKKVERLKIVEDVPDNPAENVAEADINELVETFNSEISDFMEKDGLLAKHKNSILQIKQDVSEIQNSNLSLDKKILRLNRMYNDYEKMCALINKDVQGILGAYEEYKKECFDAIETPKEISEFSSRKEIEDSIHIARENAEKQLSKRYIKRQIDEVMEKHGYDIVKSDMLEQVNTNGQILYGVDQDTAIDVFVSNDNQVTMRVVGVGFDSQISESEDENLYQQQCAFCSLHPQITAELAMRGVILHTKNHMPPDKKFNKKIQTKSKTNTQTTSKAKKQLKQNENKVMYKS